MYSSTAGNLYQSPPCLAAMIDRYDETEPPPINRIEIATNFLDYFGVPAKILVAIAMS